MGYVSTNDDDYISYMYNVNFQFVKFPNSFVHVQYHNWTINEFRVFYLFQFI